LELEKNIRILQDKELELQKEINKLSDSQSIDIDKAVITVAPLYKQLV
jgi:ESCRT-I complex subunit TSG101